MDTSTATRLHQLIRLLDTKSVSAFATAIGVRSTVLANMLGGRLSKPSFDTLEKIKGRYPQVNLDWLVMGTGTPLLADVAAPPATLAVAAPESKSRRDTAPTSDVPEAALRTALADSQRELAHWQEKAETYRQLAEDRQTIIELLKQAAR